MVWLSPDNLGANVTCQPDDVKAKMENGILTITFPKISPEQQAKRIVIQQIPCLDTFKLSICHT